MNKTNPPILCSTSLPLPEAKTAPTWIEIFPAGTITAIDGRGPWTLSDPEQVIANSIRPKTDISIDRDHETDLPQFDGKHKPAAGWIKHMEVRDGAIWANVDWTSYAEYQITSREYRYVSPVFSTNKAGEVQRIKRLSLTNDPALEITALAHNQSSQNIKSTKETTNMKLEELLKQLASAMGHKKTFTAEGIIVACAAIKSENDKVQKDYKELCSSLGASDDASQEDIVILASAKTDKTDPSEFVPMKAFKELTDVLASLQKNTADKNATDLVDTAMTEGKISPAMKDWALELASSNPDAFNKYLETAPVIASSQATASKSSNPDHAGLTDEDIQIASAMGIDPKTLIKKEGDE